MSHCFLSNLDWDWDYNRVELRHIQNNRTNKYSTLYLQRRSAQYRVGLSSKGTVLCV